MQVQREIGPDVLTRLTKPTDEIRVLDKRVDQTNPRCRGLSRVHLIRPCRFDVSFRYGTQFNVDRNRRLSSSIIRSLRAPTPTLTLLTWSWTMCLDQS